jgi:DNA repair exonuclease SbcCD nuclease subunit
MSSVYVCGDTHGLPEDTTKLNTKKFPEQKTMTSDDVVVQLGDFGWIWYPAMTNAEQEYWLDWLAAKNFTLAVVPGNHENYDIIEKLPLIEKWGNLVHVLSRKTGDIYILLRGAVYTINGKKVFTCGGATSTDKEHRRQGISWWPQETLNKKEENRALDELQKHNWDVDYILTHTCPEEILPLFLPNNSYFYLKDPVGKFLNFIHKQVEFKEWHFGHVHVDKRLNDFFCHYNKPPVKLF